MRFLLVRHGATLNNAEARYTGQSDVPLSELGERQAVAVGKRLASETLDVIVSSDLQRARLTARAIAHHHALPVWEDADLREAALGKWEGLTFAEVALRDADLVARRHIDPDCAPPGGETFIQLRDRVVRALERWQTRYPRATMLWVTHGGVMEVLVCHLLDIDLKHRRQFRHYNASITEFDLSRDYAILVHLNENVLDKSALRSG